ncbi:MAG: glycosyltransferase [Magnetococcales bacterium]|nr:glycosyltransferase [Magnetococcales bacterium]MBF0110708.1 glycosyltransferase [Magnetococcales bacterium]MBF0117066.1 glycosyltransferase [Magnetococcales bacterium]
MSIESPCHSYREIQHVPTVSVIMNCFNCVTFLRDAIDSVYRQTFTDWEIIFWDNASTDGSCDIVRGYDSRLRYFRGNEHVPLGRARNMALRQACGRYIAFLDCDDLWYPEKLEKQLALFSRRNDIKFVYSMIYMRFEKTSRKKIMKISHPYGDFFSYSLVNYKVPMLTSMMTRKELMELDEYFDERLSLAEEFELFMRFFYRYKVACVCEPLGEYRVHQTSSSNVKIDQWVDELTYILRKFERIIPDFNERYHRQIRVYSAKINYNRALCEMRKGDVIKARHYLRDVALVNYKLFIWYLISLLPKQFWNFIHRYRVVS